MIRFEHEGQEYEFKGIYTNPGRGDNFLDNGGHVTEANNDLVFAGQIRAIVHPIPRTQTFGGVVFEEVGHRTPKAGEWFEPSYDKGHMEQAGENLVMKSRIFRPVRLEGTHEN